MMGEEKERVEETAAPPPVAKQGERRLRRPDGLGWQERHVAEPLVAQEGAVE